MGHPRTICGRPAGSSHFGLRQPHADRSCACVPIGQAFGPTPRGTPLGRAKGAEGIQIKRKEIKARAEGNQSQREGNPNWLGGHFLHIFNILAKNNPATRPNLHPLPRQILAFRCQTARGERRRRSARPRSALTGTIAQHSAYRKQLSFLFDQPNPGQPTRLAPIERRGDHPTPTVVVSRPRTAFW
jgi:hypothetical protein